MTPLLPRILRPPRRDLPPALARHSTAPGRLDPGRPIGEVDFVAFDTELTGLNFRGDSIISIGAVHMQAGRIRLGETFYRLVRPEAELKRDGILVHELTHSELEQGEETGTVLADFLDFLGDAVLVGHFAYIDVNFVHRALKRYFGTGLRSPSIDTRAIHDWLNENDSRFARHHGGISLQNDLFSLAQRYGIVIDHAHNAFYDAYVTAQLFQRFLHFLPGCGIRTLKELLSVGRS